MDLNASHTWVCCSAGRLALLCYGRVSPTRSRREGPVGAHAAPVKLEVTCQQLSGPKQMIGSFVVVNIVELSFCVVCVCVREREREREREVWREKDC